MKVLAVGAHPDDIEILCAGTLTKFKAGGHSIAMATMCNGDKGHITIPSAELAVIRAQEARKSAALLDAQVFTGRFPDLELYVNRESVDHAVEIIRTVKPDVIITHAPNDYMVDHINTSQVVVNASFIASLPNYRTATPAHMPVCPLYFMDCVATPGPGATEFVDVTDHMALKEKMLLCHQSQYLWLKEHDGIDYVEFMKTLSAYRGLECGARYAEGFRAYQVFGRVRTHRILP